MSGCEIKGFWSSIPITTKRLKISIISGLSTCNLLGMPLLKSKEIERQKFGRLQRFMKVSSTCKPLFPFGAFFLRPRTHCQVLPLLQASPP